MQAFREDLNEQPKDRVNSWGMPKYIILCTMNASLEVKLPPAKLWRGDIIGMITSKSPIIYVGVTQHAAKLVQLKKKKFRYT